MRFQKKFLIGEDGSFNMQDMVGGNKLLDLDVDHDKEEGKLQMNITKEEFIACMMNSTLLGECLRQITTSDNRAAVNPTAGRVEPGQVPKGKPIKLDVTISDPAEEQVDEDFMDIMDVRQGVLFEIWDFDRASKDDFLGECWLPSLGSWAGHAGKSTRQFVLPITNAPDEQDVTLTRPDGKKVLPKEIVCKGHLHVEATWHFPAVDADLAKHAETLDERVKAEARKHTGKLTIKIVKATMLRVADNFAFGRTDLNRNKGCDPYVAAYIRNESFKRGDKLPIGFADGGWRVNQITGMFEPIFQSSWKKSTVNPEWNETMEVILMTGAFEKRTKKFTLDITARQKQRADDDYAIGVMNGDRQEVKVCFTDGEDRSVRPGPGIQPSAPRGHRHNVQVFFQDSVNQLKVLVSKACLIEAQYETDPQIRAQYEAAAKEMSHRHAVMIFVPSTRLRELAQDNRNRAHEYKRLYRIEQEDPSSWQPLDEIKTFSHYAMKYGFGMARAQNLKITAATDDYKAKNIRYRAFEQEQKRWNLRLEDTNSDSSCFGYAKLVHPRDAHSFEWRQVLVDRPDGDDAGKRKYKVTFIHSPLAALLDAPPAAGTGLEEVRKVVVEEDALLLAPLHPKIMGSRHLEHQELLAKVRGLQDKGLDEAQICDMLNAELTARWQKTREMENQEGGAKSPAPVRISLADVQFAIRKADAAEMGR